MLNILYFLERLCNIILWFGLNRVKMVVDAPASVAYKLYADRELFPKWLPFLSSVEVSLTLKETLRRFHSFTGYNNLLLLLGSGGQSRFIALFGEIRVFW